MFAFEWISFGSIQVWLIAIITFLVAYNYLMKESWRGLPPGPPNLPIIGSLLFLGADIRKPLRKMAAKYGPVFTIYLGMRRTIVIDGYDAIQEAFVNNAHAFSGRPHIYFLDGLTEGYGIVSAQGDTWREQRRYALKVLRDFGVGRSILEERILEEVSFCIRELSKHTDKPFYTQPIIQRSVANVIASVIFGKRYEYDDPVFTRYMEIMNDCFEVIGNGGAISLFPFLRYLPGDLFSLRKLERHAKYMTSERNKTVQEHKVALKENSGEKEPSDFIDAYLKKINDDSTTIAESSFTERQLDSVLGDIFGAGTETTSTTLSWAIIYMTLNQNVQSRVHTEIDDVIGNDEVPSMSLRQHMPYTEACICEIQRLGDIVPFSVPHATTEDVYFRGYYIPKGTMIMPSLYSTNMDPQIWPDPEKFLPERFLNEEGRIKKIEQFIPFSTGKRQCLREGLARMELFLYFVSLMKHFRFRSAPGYPDPDTCGILGITNMPKPFHVIMEARH